MSRIFNTHYFANTLQLFGFCITGASECTYVFRFMSFYASFYGIAILSRANQNSGIIFFPFSRKPPSNPI